MKGDLLECWEKIQGLIGEGRLSHSAIVLYTALLDKWRYLRRPSEFNMTNEVLRKSAGFGSEHSLLKARAELVQAGLVSFDRSKKLFGSVYRIL